MDSVTPGCGEDKYLLTVFKYVHTLLTHFTLRAFVVFIIGEFGASTSIHGQIWASIFELFLHSRELNM